MFMKAPLVVVAKAQITLLPQASVNELSGDNVKQALGGNSEGNDG